MRASRTYKSGNRRRLERLLGETAIRVALLVFVIWTLAPVAWMIVSSLLNQIALTSVPPDLSPGQLTLDNYRGCWRPGESGSGVAELAAHLAADDQASRWRSARRRPTPSPASRYRAATRSCS